VQFLRAARNCLYIVVNYGSATVERERESSVQEGTIMGTGDRGSSAAAGRPSAGSKNNYSRMLKRKTVGLRLLSFFVICIMSLRLIQKSSVVLVESPMAFVELTVPSQNISRQAVLSTEELPGEKEYSRRLFLGIFTSPMYDMRLRNMIRTTYLQINAKLENGSSTEAPLPKICSLPEFSLETSSKSTNGFSTCQIIYSFIAEGEFNPKYASEVDMLFLNMTNENKENEGSNIVYQLYDYILNSYPARVDGTSSSSRDFRFDFVAYTHCRVVLYPHRLWPREMFGGVSSNTTKFSVYSHPRIYSRAVSSEKPDNKRNLRTHGYTLLSITLLETVMRHPSFHSGIAKRQTLKFILEQIIGSSSTIIGDDSSTTKEVPATSTIIIPLKDSVYIYEDSEYERYSYMPFITQWDAYKDTWLVTYEDPEEEARVRSNPRINHTIGTCQYGPRILLGIFTTKNDAKEIKRRTAIRETYLRSYLDSDKRTANDTIGSHRICSLANLLSSNHPEHSQLLRECQIAYTFVAGGNPDGPTERVEFNISEPMILPTTSHDEKDLVLLNIRENMKQGKSQSFFKYATSIVDEHI
jgi:hypothetical protein